MEKRILEFIKAQLNDLSRTSTSTNLLYRQGHSLYLNGQCTRLSASENHFEFSVNDKYGDYLVKIDSGDRLTSSCECEAGNLCRHQAAAMMQLHELIKIDQEDIPAAGIKYTRSGMIKRVVEERKNKALHAHYTIQYADNIFGEHLLTNERGIQYKLTFRDIDRRHGYCSCPDYKTNKLGTCKHLIFAFDKFLKNQEMIPDTLPKYPFVEVFLNPFRDYKISWFYPEKIFGELAELFYRYFGNKKYIEDQDAETLLGFFNNLDKHKQILVRPEVYEKVDKISGIFALRRIEETHKPDFSKLKTQLLPYQQQGVEFATFKKGAVIADEMGLGKALQAIAIATMKKEIFGFSKTLIICPAILKPQWKKEIEMLTGEIAALVEGSKEERQKIYSRANTYFNIVSYETVMRDKEIISRVPVDFIILDEAERIKNYASPTSAVIKSIPRKHALVLTGSPIETELINLYSVILFVDPDLLSPLWEFSYQHCYFDSQTKNTVVGYYDLQELKQKLNAIFIRRERQEVIKQLPNISQINIPVKLSAHQKKMHLKYARSVLDIYNKKIISSFDKQKTMQLAKKMRMLANSTFLVDDATNVSPKLDELQHILLYKLHLKKNKQKVVIFTEWDKMINIISRMLRVNKIIFMEAFQKNSEEEQKKLFSRFENNNECSVFICPPQAAGIINLAGVNTIINMEVSCNKTEKNHQLGSIDSLSKRNVNLTIINLIAENSIEAKLAEGLKMDVDLPESLNQSFAGEKLAEHPGMLHKNFIDALKDTIEQIILTDEPSGHEPSTHTGQMSLNFTSDEETEDATDSFLDTDEKIDKLNETSQKDELGRIDNREIEGILKSGVDFLSQLLRISTGKQINLREDKLSFDPDTGEIILKFKIPKS